MGGKTSRLMSAKNKEVSTVRRVFIEAHGQLGLRQERNAVVHGPALAGHAEILRSGEGKEVWLFITVSIRNNIKNKT